MMGGMSDPVRKPAGWADLAALPEDVKAEVVAGELYTAPRPRPAHGRAQALLAGNLAGPFDLGSGGGPGGWWIVVEPDVQLSEQDVVSPDLAGWRRSRVPDFPTERPVVAVPDWICEVASPSSVRRDRTVKADLYLRSGVPYYWLLDPEERTLEAFEAQEGRWVRLGAWSDGDRAAVAPFDAREMDVGSLFPPIA
jgi:Uma2 family endonuclease